MHMQRLTTILTAALVVILALLAVPVQPTAARPLEQAAPGVADVTFAQLNIEPAVLFSPIDQTSTGFTLPYRWQMIGAQNYLDLTYSMFYEGYDAEAPEEQQDHNATVDVYINNTLLGSFSPQVGDNLTARVAIPSDLINDPDSNRHLLRVVFETENCLDPRQTRLSLHDTSLMHLEYELLPLELNLARFPRPLVQDRFTPETVAIIIPDEYNDIDLASASSVAATLGSRTTRDNIAVQLVTASEATPELLADTSAIIIGQPDRNSFLAGLYERGLLPTTLAEGAADIVSAEVAVQPEDGVLQLIPSEVNPDQAYLVLTASTDSGVHRAARALAMREPRYGLVGDLGVVKALSDLSTPTSAFTDTMNLEELGYFDAPFFGVGTQSSSVDVVVPSSWRFTDNPTLTLMYLHSANLEPETSALNVRLNSKPIGSAPIDPENQGVQQVEIELPLEDFRPGQTNYLTFESVVKLTAECEVPPESAIWTRVLGSSTIHMPHEDDNPLRIPSDDVRLLFTGRQDLGDVWFALSDNPSSQELNGMTRTAWNLGRASRGQGFAPRVSRGNVDTITTTDTFPELTVEDDTATAEAADADTIPAELESLQPYHVIAFGQPTSNPLLGALNEQLPQPFEADSGNLSQQVGNVVYRLPQDASLGVAELLHAPWNTERAVLALTGTTPEGVGWAIDALNSKELVTELTGNVNFIISDEIEAVDSTDMLDVPLREAVESMEEGEVEAEMVVAEEEAEPAPTEAAAIAEASEITPAAEEAPPAAAVAPAPDIMPIAGGLIAVGLLVALVGTIVSIRRGRKPRTATQASEEDDTESEA